MVNLGFVYDESKSELQGTLNICIYFDHHCSHVNAISANRVNAESRQRPIDWYHANRHFIVKLVGVCDRQTLRAYRLRALEKRSPRLLAPIELCLRNTLVVSLAKPHAVQRHTHTGCLCSDDNDYSPEYAMRGG